MKKKIIAVFLLACMLLACMLLACAAFADGETTKAMEDGHLRLPFENGYHGFCINYYEPEAEKDDVYLVCSTDKAINRTSGENIGNYLKVLATQFQDIFLGDDTKAQHYVWHFSDDFTGWRVSPDVAQDIREAASEIIIPDHGYTRRIGDTTYVWDFMVLDEMDGDAIFFAYKYTAVNDGVPGEAIPLPETGDGANIVLWSALTAIGIIGMAMMLRKKKKA